jgi:hypothetical protein
MLRVSTFLLIGIFAASLSFANGPIQNERGVRNVTVILGSSVVMDPNDEIAQSEQIGSVGVFKYSLDGGEAQLGLGQTARATQGMKVVELVGTAVKGITDGKIFVQYVPGTDPTQIPVDYGLQQVEVFPGINRLLLKVDDLGRLESVQDELERDFRVVKTELDIFYGEPVLQ